MDVCIAYSIAFRNSFYSILHGVCGAALIIQLLVCIYDYLSIQLGEVSMNKWDSQSACFSINPICLDAYCSIIAKYCAEYDYEGDNENYDFFISFNANTFFY
ncbi:MAG: hypothetical protein U0L35_00575 [Methanobrevibacter sp.]|nr:hypothetical protein [Methanobrevibacter sp.]